MRFRFRHPIVRHAVYEHAGAGWRIGAHARAAAALASAGAGATQRAHHVERSAAPGDDAAIAVLVEAAHASATRAPATAAGWFAAALRLLPSGPESDARRLELLVPLATALGGSGQLEAARATLEELGAVIPSSLGAARAQVTILRAQIDFCWATSARAARCFTRRWTSTATTTPRSRRDLKLGAVVRPLHGRRLGRRVRAGPAWPTTTSRPAATRSCAPRPARSSPARRT